VRILILGDSLPFPRPHKGQPVDVTWPSLIKARIPDADVWLRATPRSCILDVIKEYFFFTDSLPAFDVVIVQTGIVDCAPRPYSRWIYKFLETFLGMAKLRKIERFAHDHLLWLYGRPWVSQNAFVQGIRQIVETTHGKNPALTTLFVPIAPPTRTIVQTLTGIDHAAALYNRIIEREVSALKKEFLCDCVQPFSNRDPFEITIEDGHHLSVVGHRLIAEALVTTIKNIKPLANKTPLSTKQTEPVSLSAGSVWPKSARTKDRGHMVR
jgi:lysophospholipase L1-like esterase